MRGLIAVLVLVCGGAAQLTPLHCSSGVPGEGAGVPAGHHEALAAGDHHTPGHRLHGGTDDHRVPASDDAAEASSSESPHQTDPGCPLMLACGAAGLAAAPAPVTHAPLATMPPASFVTATGATLFATHETPPPRLPV